MVIGDYTHCITHHIAATINDVFQRIEVFSVLLLAFQEGRI
jgi:hypothetical protein